MLSAPSDSALTAFGKMSHHASRSVVNLVESDRVHRDVYVDSDVFQLEQDRLFARTWIFAGHASQMEKAGDFVTVTIAARPVLLIRQSDASVRAFYNRCAHKGSQLVTDPSGNVGRFIKCPYHAWTYKLDGNLLGLPLKNGYDGTRLMECESGKGLTEIKNINVYRDFIFVRLADQGEDFLEYFGDVLTAIDNMVDRSPERTLKVEGGIIRNVIDCNWKMYIENINDTVHPLSTHESATQAASKAWATFEEGAAKPMAMEQILPFGSGYDFFDNMGGRVFRNGHSILGVNFSAHSNYARLPEYEQALASSLGPDRAKEVLEKSPQNSVLFPSLSVKGSPQAIRVIRPLAANKTLIEAWSFRAMGAPEILFERSVSYNRLVFSPMSFVAHDDVHLFESMQTGLASEGNHWVSLHRDFREGEFESDSLTTNGTNEILIRNQFRAWAKFMAPDQDGNK